VTIFLPGEGMMTGLDANGRVDKALRLLTPALQPVVEKELRRVYQGNWKQNISAAHGTDPSSLDAYALLKTMLDNWQTVFRANFKVKTRTDVSKSLDGRNAVSHANDVISDADAISYLTAIRGVAEAIQAKTVAGDVTKLIDAQIKAAASAMGIAPEVAAKNLSGPVAPELDLGDRKYQWKPWRDICPPHPDVMAARFIEADFAANLADVARGEGPETYRDAREFFRITYMTGGLRQVLQRAIERLAGKGGDPVIGLQTSFGGGKTHTMLALYHLASAKSPETLPGLGDAFSAAGVKSLLVKSKPVVFVGSALGANQPIAIEGARTVKSLWGLIAVKLGGWKAYETIQASDEARTNPGSEAMLPILREAAPCLILLDEVVAYARNLEGLPYDGFVSFFQSLTEAAKAVPGVLLVGSLPESGAEVGNERGRAALLQLEKIFGRIQSAWTPAQGTETFEIIRRRLFQELDDEGLKAREQAVKSFLTFYRNNPGEFPTDVRDRAYEAQMLAAYPVHPELFRILQGDWGGLEKFQKTRGVLKMMAQIVYRLWRDQHSHPMIMPGDVPLTDDRVRTNALDPVAKGYDAVVTKEIAGELSKPAQIEARSPSVGKNKAVTRAATALFMATSPFGSTNRGVEVARLRLSCAIPGEQPSQFSEALRRLGENAAYLYSQGENYWFSPIASLNQEAEDRAKALLAPQVDAEILDLVRAEERLKGAGFLRVHAAPDDPLGIDDAHEAALVILPPSAWHRGREQDTPAMKLAADIVEHKGPGQRRNRNRLAFLAVDQAALVDIESIARRKIAWESIVGDSRTLQLPRAQEDEAKKKAAEQEAAAVNAIRRGWKHLLLPQEPQPASQHAARGFDLEPTALSNRSIDPEPLPQVAWKKCEQDGLIVSTLGVLDNDLEKVWQPPDQPHLSVRQLRDWFAQFPYLSKLREPSVLARALSATVAHSDAKYALADGFDAAKGEYTGLKLRQLVEVKLDSDALIVRRSVAEVQIQKGETAGGTTHPPGGLGPQPSPSRPSGGAPTPTNGAVAPRPRRFYAKVVLDPARPTPMVSQIAQSILSELDRVRGTTITITLDIDAESPAGFPQDVEDVVRDNAKTLKIVEFDFAKE
jgi:predicted AAA+ superfamily ATPase